PAIPLNSMRKAVLKADPTNPTLDQPSFRARPYSNLSHPTQAGNPDFGRFHLQKPVDGRSEQGQCRPLWDANGSLLGADRSTRRRGTESSAQSAASLSRSRKAVSIPMLPTDPYHEA